MVCTCNLEVLSAIDVEPGVNDTILLAGFHRACTKLRIANLISTQISRAV